MDGLRSSLAFSVLFLLAGCAAVDKKPYPEAWPPAVTGSQSCHEITGRYENRAVTQTYAHPHRDYLLALTLLPVDTDYRRIKTMVLEYEGGVLHTAGFSADGTLLARQTYTEQSGVFSCKGGVLVLNPDKVPTRQRAPDNPMVGVSSSETAFAKATDGSLIMRMSGSATGLAFLIIPAHIATEHWYRFAPSPETFGSRPAR